MNNIRNIILFTHVPKTGGQTFKNILSTAVRGKYYVYLVNEAYMCKIKPEAISCTLGNNPDVYAVCSHAQATDRRTGCMLGNNPDAFAIGSHNVWLNQEDLTSKQMRFFPIFFVRSWFDWIISHYYYVRRNRKTDPHWFKALNGFAAIIIPTASLDEYLRFISDGYIPAVCSNSSLHVLENLRSGRGSPVKNDQFMRHIRMCHIGVTERYDESLVVMEHELAPHFPGIDLSYNNPVNTNTTKETHTSTYEVEKKSADPDILRRIEEMLADAIWLHDFANADLDRKISTIPNFEERLEHFKFRCRIDVRIDSSLEWRGSR